MALKVKGQKRRGLRGGAVAALLALGIAGAMQVPGSASAAGGCGSATATGSGACVVLIEVNGLEPKDVTRQNTPFLWSLAHSGSIDSQKDPVASQYPALSGRNGWAWQAARGVMSTGNGPATASLLTGGTAEQTGIPSDLFRGGDGKWYGTGGDTAPDCGQVTTLPCDSGSQLTPENLLADAQQAGDSVGMWTGDPALCRIANSAFDGASVSAAYDWTGGGPNGTTVTGGPGSCPPLWGPASPTSATNLSPTCPPPSAWPPGQVPAACPASDVQTLTQAEQNMSSTFPQLSYIYLSDVGQAKQMSGDSDCFTESSCGGQTAPPAVSRALQSTDAAVAAFVTALQRSQGSAWSHTYLMVVGNHGYEATPPALRVPDPGNATGSPPSLGVGGSGGTVGTVGTGDLESYVNSLTHGQAAVVPQGTIATIYYTDTAHPGQETATLSKVYNALDPAHADTDTSPGTVNNGCSQVLASAQQSGAVPSSLPVSPDCIQHVYYVDPSVLDRSAMPNPDDLSQYLFGKAGDPGYPTSSTKSYDPDPHCADSSSPFYDPTGNCDPNLLSFYAKQQASWHLNALQGTPATSPVWFRPTGASGQIVVQLAPGWAAGPLASANPGQAISGAGTSPAVGSVTDPVDPYLASSGGPRDRAIAALVNGPASTGSGIKYPVVQYPDTLPGGGGDGRAPVLNEPQAPLSDPTQLCSASYLSIHPKYSDAATSLGVDQANATPGNDSAALGSPVYIPTADSSVPPGYECQAQTIDFAPTIAALLGFQFPTTGSQTADSRLLDEAFGPCKPNCLSPVQPPEDLGVVQPQIVQPAPPPVVQQPPVIIYKLPKPPKGYDFHGLIRKVQARVVDQRNDTVPHAPPGAYLSSIRITSDFGKPLSQVTITLYRDAAPAARKASGSRKRGKAAPATRRRVTAVVRFCPFTVTRDPNVQLRFEVPRVYQATYVGLAVREARALSSATGPGCGAAHHNAFAAMGPAAGVITPILDAQLLHKLKPRAGRKAQLAPGRRGL